MKRFAQLFLSASLLVAAAPNANAINIYSVGDYIPSFTNIYDIPAGVWMGVGILLTGPQLALCNTVLFCGNPYERLTQAHKDIVVLKKTGQQSEYLTKFIPAYRDNIKTSITPHAHPSDAEVDALTDQEVLDIAEFSYQVHKYSNGWTGPNVKFGAMLFPAGYQGQSSEEVLRAIQNTRIHGVGYTPGVDAEMDGYFRAYPPTEFRGPKN